MSMTEELLEIALEALAKHKITLEDIQSTAKTDKESNQETQKDIDKRIASISTDMLDTIQSEMDKIPVPKDGIDGESIEGKPGKDGQSIVGPAGKDGKSVKGDKGARGLVGKATTGKTGAKGKDGKNAVNGIDGVGITDIRSNASAITIELSNGKTKTVKLPKQKDYGRNTMAPSKRIAGTMSPGILKNLTDVYVPNALNGDVLTYDGNDWTAVTPVGGVVDIDNFKRRTEIETMFKTANSTAYKELTYNDGDITSVDIYTDSGKTVKLFTKIIGYNVDNNIDTIDITDEVNSDSISKTLAYTDGDLISVTSTYTKA